MQILVMFSFINIPKLRKPALCEKVRALKTLKNLFLFALGISSDMISATTMQKRK